MAKKIKVKTIDIQAKEWFDKINGNSYFAGEVIINFGTKTGQSFNMPFQYGYGNSYEYKALKMLKEQGFIKETHGSELRDAKILLRSSIQRNCLKRELMRY